MIIVLFVAIGFLQLGISRLQANLLYGVRAYVAGEGLWSKAQKNAMLDLLRYAETGEEKYYRSFRNDLRVNLGDKQARQALLSPTPDIEKAKEGFLEGGNHPDDIESLIWLFRNFQTMPYIADAIEIWGEGNEEIDRMVELGDQLHRTIQGGGSKAETDSIIHRLENHNRRLTTLENRFSETLGEGARWVTNTTNLANLLITLLLMIIGTILAWRIISTARAAEDALAESEERFRSSFSNAAIGMAMVGADGKFLKVNSALCAMLGYPAEELEGLTFQKITHRDDVAKDVQEAQNLLTGTKDHYITQKRYIHKDGSIINISLNVAVVRNKEGTPLYFISQMADITDRVRFERQLREAHNEQKTILENTLVGIAYLRDRRITWANNRFCELVEVDGDELDDRPLQTFFAAEAPQADKVMERAYRLLEAGQSYTDEIEFRRSDTSEFWVRVSAKAINPRRLEEGSIWVLENITERKKAQQEIIRQKEKAEEATRLKDKFVSLVSHDLRSPLGNIAGLIKIVLEGRGGAMPDEAGEFLTMAHKSAQDLLTLINELLNISRLKTGKMTPEPVFHRAEFYLLKALAEHQRAAEEKGLRLKLEQAPNPRLYADPHLLSEVMSNLVSNAIKFTPKGGTVTLSCGGNGDTRLSVADTGIGLKTDDAETLFSYEQKTSTPGTDGEKGTGLGLPLSRDLVQAHGGELTVDGNPEGGTTFTITLPKKEPTILLVNDDPATLTRLKVEIESAGRVVTAGDGQQALAIMQEEEVHIIVSDIFMPELNGLELVERIRKHPDYRHLPVILVTADQKLETRDRAFQAGADDFYFLQSHPSDLLPRVKRFID